MDYKELISILRNGQPHVILEYSDDAAAAIETLMAERDAAVNDINAILKAVTDEHCNFCVWKGNCPEEFFSCENNARWRGLQKEVE